MGDSRESGPRVRIANAITEVLSSQILLERRLGSKNSSVDEARLTVEDLAEAVEYLTDELIEQGISLPDALSPSVAGHDVKDDERDVKLALATHLGGEPTLERLEGHPAFSLVVSTMQELLLFGPESAQSKAPTILEDLLETLVRPKSSEDSANAKKARHKKGTLGECELCERSMPLTEHHLIPRSEHHRLASQGVYTLTEMRMRLAMLCRPCHSAVHSMFSHEELSSSYNTMELLLQHDGVCKWGNYASKLKERQSGYEGFGLKHKR
ncbi:unnamed protein product [Sympodiomycopsis kandeliae]